MITIEARIHHFTNASFCSPQFSVGAKNCKSGELIKQNETEQHHFAPSRGGLKLAKNFISKMAHCMCQPHTQAHKRKKTLHGCGWSRAKLSKLFLSKGEYWKQFCLLCLQNALMFLTFKVYF